MQGSGLGGAWAFETPGSSLLVLGSRGTREEQFIQRRVSGISSLQNDILREEGETDVTTVETWHVVASQRANANPELMPQVHVSPILRARHLKCSGSQNRGKVSAPERLVREMKGASVIRAGEQGKQCESRRVKR